MTKTPLTTVTPLPTYSASQTAANDHIDRRGKSTQTVVGVCGAIAVIAILVIVIVVCKRKADAWARCRKGPDIPGTDWRLNPWKSCHKIDSTAVKSDRIVQIKTAHNSVPGMRYRRSEATKPVFPCDLPDSGRFRVTGSRKAMQEESGLTAIRPINQAMESGMVEPDDHRSTFRRKDFEN
jgi:hypothetical protein